MSRQFRLKRLQNTASVLALSTAAVFGSSAMQPVKAADGLFGGGSSLVSLAMRQIMDCYNGTPVDPSASVPGGCGVASGVEGLYAAVGSGNGFRGFIANDPHQFFLGTPNPTITLPATPPPFIDTAAAAPFNTYPYPNVDFGASDSPLPAATPPVSSGVFVTFTPTSGWESSPATATGTTTVTYATANFGAPIQLPLIEAPVAIALNTNGLTINSGLASPSDPGGAIQLTTAQLCAIFSGAVTDWNDTTTSIAWLNSTNSIGTQSFKDANIGNGTSTSVAYSSTSLPIKVVFRSDGSGTSFIITNYLKSACPQLDNGSNKYAQIFGGSNLPSTAFTQLTANINAAFPGAGRTTNWIGADGSQNVAQAINNVTDDGAGTTFTGRIGYLSADFTQPYADPSVLTYVPLSASVQNEQLRVAGTYLPASSSGGSNAPTFIPPTPAGADLAFGSLAVPGGSATYNDWNIYADVWASGTTSGGVNIGGKSKLGIPTVADAYPVMGTSFIGVYQCYRANGGTVHRATRLSDFLNWYYGPDSGGPSIPRTVLESNGFGALQATLRAAAKSKLTAIEAAGTGNCASMSGG